MKEHRSTARANLGGGSNLDQLMPVFLFIACYNLVNTEVAVVASTGWSVKAAYSRRRRGLPIGKWLPTITAYFLVRAAVAIAVERDFVDFGVSSEAAYFGIGIGTKLLVGVVVAGTILVNRPLLAWLLPKIVNVPATVRSASRYRSTMRNMTWLIVLYQIGSAVWDIWLFNNSGVNVFLLTRQVVNFVVAFVVVSGALLYMDHRLGELEDYPGLAELFGSPKRKTRQAAQQMTTQQKPSTGKDM